MRGWLVSAFLLGVCCAHAEAPSPSPCQPSLRDRLTSVWVKSFEGKLLSDVELQTFSDTLDCLEHCESVLR